MSGSIPSDRVNNLKNDTEGNRINGSDERLGPPAVQSWAS